VASRLTSLAKAGEILISKSTYELIDREKKKLKIEERGKVSVKGRRTKIDVFNVLSLEKV
jgi:class 3 adenylate cyclase